jgi:hypothetical protein
METPQNIKQSLYQSMLVWIKNFIKNFSWIGFIIAFIAGANALAKESPIFLENFNKIFRYQTYLSEKLSKIKTGFQINAIKEIMNSEPQKVEVWKDCREYSWIDPNFILQVTSDSNGNSYSYSVIGLNNFNFKPNFTDKVVLNKTNFQSVKDSFRQSYEYSLSRGENGSYFELHSNLGGTSNLINVEYSHNFNYSDSDVMFIGNTEKNKQNFPNLLINSLTFTNLNYASSDQLFEKKLTFECNAKQGKGNVLIYDNKDNF